MLQGSSRNRRDRGFIAVSLPRDDQPHGWPRRLGAAACCRCRPGQFMGTASTVGRHGPKLRELGNLPQDFGVYPELSARRFLLYMSAMKLLPDDGARRRDNELLELVNLTRDADRRLRTFSGGMKQRVGIAQAL